MLISVLFVASVLGSTAAVNFDWENVQLTKAETANYSAIRFADQGPEPSKRECKYLPGDEAWPSDAAWATFNETLDGALLKPLPLASVCYIGPNYDSVRCEQLKKTWTFMNMQ